VNLHKMDIKQIQKDFEFIKGKALGVVLFGSYAKRKETRRSDIDICLISPKVSLMEVLRVVGGRYDTKIFEDLPLSIKIEIIRNHQVIIGNEVNLSWYFYKFRKLWGDMRYRIKKYSFKNAGKMIKMRRGWMNEKKTKVS